MIVWGRNRWTVALRLQNPTSQTGIGALELLLGSCVGIWAPPRRGGGVRQAVSLGGLPISREDLRKHRTVKINKCIVCLTLALQ